jgi:hypothetical protein
MDNQLVITPKSFFRSLLILFWAMVAGQVIFGLITFFQVSILKKGSILDRQILDIMLWIAPGLAVSGIALGWIFFDIRLKVLRDKSNLREKLSGYQSAMIVKLAMMEGPSLLALVLFFLSGEYIFLAVAAFVVLVFLFSHPTKAKIIQQLQLHDDERMLLDDADAYL